METYRGVHSETWFGFLSIIHKKSLQQKEPRARSGTASHSVEDLETISAGIMATSEVVGGIFFTTDELLWVKKNSIMCSFELHL